MCKQTPSNINWNRSYIYGTDATCTVQCRRCTVNLPFFVFCFFPLLALVRIQIICNVVLAFLSTTHVKSILRIISLFFVCCEGITLHSLIRRIGSSTTSMNWIIINTACVYYPQMVEPSEVVSLVSYKSRPNALER